MARLLSRAELTGKLRIDDPHCAADQFFSLVKGGANFCLLIGCGEPLHGAAAEQHVQNAVTMFMRAYRPNQATG
jgi:TetR/AcrR family transcriptional repressor of mexJK operon